MKRQTLLAFLVCGPLGAQEVPLTFDRLSVEDGLASSTVYAFHQDHRGFMWIGTLEGLNRHDGYGFEVYRHDPADPGSLAGDLVLAIAEDRGGDLWIGTFDSGVDRFDHVHERFEHWRHDPAEDRRHDPAAGGLSHDSIHDLLVDRDGVLWAGTDDGLDRFDAERQAFAGVGQDPPQPGGAPSRQVYALYEDGSGELWVGTGAGLFRLDRPSGTLERPRAPSGDVLLASGTVLAITGDGDGLWIATAADGLQRLDPETGEVAVWRHDPADPHSLGENALTDLALDRSGELWIGTASRGLNRLDRSTGAFRHHRYAPFEPGRLADDGTLDLFEDRTGVLWIGTYDGISKLAPSRQQFVTYRQRPGSETGLSGRGIWPVFEDRFGILWVGTWDRGLDRVERPAGEQGVRRVVNYAHDPADPASLPHDAVTAICEDAAGTLWIGTWAGLSRFDRASGDFVTYRHDREDSADPVGGRVYALLADGSGRLWVGTSSGLERLDGAGAGRDGRWVRYPVTAEQPASLGQTPIYALVEDRDGAIWVGSDRDGLYRLDPQSRAVAHYRHDPADGASLSTDQIASLYVDRSGRLWVGTWSGGLNRFDGSGRFTRYRQQQGLPSDTVDGLLEDDRGRLWLSTSRGLSRFDPGTDSFRNYGVEDGLQGSVFTVGSAFRSASGELFFGGVQGLTAFFPDRIRDDPHPPQVAVTDFLLFNRSAALGGDPGSPLERSISETEALVLTHRDYVFGFEFAALHYAKPTKNRYAYRLEGFDRDWIETGASKRFAQYSNIAAGEYVFRVRASNGDGVWNDEGAAIRVVVLPPPWKTWWAWALYAAALVAVVAGFVRRQQRKTERQRRLAEHERQVNRELRELADELQVANAELKSFTYTVSHDLKSPLVTIMGFLGFLRRDAEAGKTERIAHDVERIEAAARKLEKLLNDLLELSRVGRMVNPAQRVEVGELASEAVRMVAGRIAERRAEVEIAAELPAVLGDRVRLLQVFQNLIDNAVKYMGDQPAPRVEVGARPAAADDGGPVFYVRDNGLGIEPRYRDQIFGLFQQLDAEAEGTGVGLALVKRIVELHGGRVWVESEGLGKGSSFCFTLSAVPPPSGSSDDPRPSGRGLP